MNQMDKKIKDRLETLKGMVKDLDKSAIEYLLDSIIDLVKDKMDVVRMNSDFEFEYKGFKCELSSCNNIVRKDQILGLTKENFPAAFPHGVFSDRYVCWLRSNVNDNGETEDECEDPDCWSPVVYLVPDGWAWGSEFDLEDGKPVDKLILDAIDKFLEEHPEIK